MEKLSEIQKLFLKQALRKQRTLAIGIWRPEPEVVDSLWLASGYADLIVVGSKIDGLNCIPTKDDDEASHKIMELLKEGKIEGFVRAQLKDSYTHKVYLEMFNHPAPKYRITPITIAKDEHWFTIANSSNYNSLTLEQMITETERSARWLENLGFKPQIGICSTRRLTGRVGEFGLLEEIAKRCQETANWMREKGYEVKEYYIEYEKAVWEGCNLIVASIGMIGNTWSKGLIYHGDWTVVTCPTLDEGTYYEASTRENTNWLWPVISTQAWINREKD